jgi:hypothetical protein
MPARALVVQRRALREGGPAEISTGGSLKRPLTALSLAVLLTTTVGDARRTPFPGPSTGPPAARVVRGMGTVTNADCAGCHPQIAAEWRASLHRQSFTDPSFTRAFSVEPLPLCRGCHAPEADPSAPPPARAAHEGVGCTTCHVVDGAVASVHGHRREAPHATRKSPWLASPQACARCHQFDFPQLSNTVVPTPMQNTVVEHAASSFATSSCQSCHMPPVPSSNGGTHRSHQFGVRDDPSMLRRAVKATATWAGPNTLAVVLESDRVGHAFPTGEVFRRLVVQAVAVRGTPAFAAWATPIYLTRAFADVPMPGGAAFRKVEVRDTRLGPPGTPGAKQTHLFTLPDYPDDAIVVWAVQYQRLNAPVDGADQVEDEVVIAGGVMPAQPRQP